MLVGDSSRQKRVMGEIIIKGPKGGEQDIFISKEEIDWLLEAN